MDIRKAALALSAAAAVSGIAAFSAYAQQGAGADAAAGTAKLAVTASAEKFQAEVTVVGIDRPARKITLAGKQRTVEVSAGPQITILDQIQVGERYVAEYTPAIMLDLVKRGAVRSQRRSDATDKEVTILAEIVAVNAKVKILTVRGPRGNSLYLHVVHAHQLKNVKKGDKVTAVLAEAVLISLKPLDRAANK